MVEIDIKGWTNPEIGSRSYAFALWTFYKDSSTDTYYNIDKGVADIELDSLASFEVESSSDVIG